MSWQFNPHIEFHPLADVFPFIEGDEHERLTADIARHGLHEPIILLDGKILDGRNRYNALLKLGSAQKDWFESFDAYCTRTGTKADPAQFVVSRNIHRRHLSASQRAMAAARIANMRQGARRDLQADPAKTANLQKVEAQTSIKDAADLLNVSPRSVANAKKVQDKAAPELTDAVRDGKVHVSAAAELTSLTLEEQADLIKQMDPKAFGRVAKEQRDKKTAEKKAKRAEKEQALGAKQLALPAKKYGVIYADPEWLHETWSDAGKDRAPENHYPCSSLDIIKSRPVADIAAKDAALFLWVPRPHVPQGLEVVAAWGFTYKTMLVWHKMRKGLGRWARDNAEILIVATKGNVPCPAMGEQGNACESYPKGKHSEKPDEYRQLIERYFPTLPRIELNARVRMPGWDVWGNEAPTEPQKTDPQLPAPVPEIRSLTDAELALSELADRGDQLLARKVPKGQATVKDLLPPHTEITLKATAASKGDQLVVLKVNGPYGGHDYQTFSIAVIPAKKFDPAKNHRATNWLSSWVAIDGQILPSDPTNPARIEVAANKDAVPS